MASTDSSQRISVAAFREAQARRSSTNLARGSPSPQPLPRPISMSNSVNSDTPPPRPPRAARPPAGPSPRDSNTSSYSANDSSTSESSSAEESDSEEHSPSRSRSRLGRQRTITKRSYRASTDLGHGNSSRATSSHHKQITSTRSELGHGSTSRTAHASPSRGPPPSSFQKPADASVGTRSFSLYRRQRASYSTSELTPNAAAKRASVVVAANDRGVFSFFILTYFNLMNVYTALFCRFEGSNAKIVQCGQRYLGFRLWERVVGRGCAFGIVSATQKTW